MLGGMLCRSLRKQLSTACYRFVTRKDIPPESSSIRPPRQPFKVGIKQSKQQPPQSKSYQQKNAAPSDGQRPETIRKYPQRQEYDPNFVFPQAGNREIRLQKEMHPYDPLSRQVMEAMLQPLNIINIKISKYLKRPYLPLSDFDEAYWYFFDYVNACTNNSRIMADSFDMHMQYQPFSTITDLITKFPSLTRTNKRRINNVLAYIASMGEMQIKQNRFIQDPKLESMLMWALQECRSFIIFLEEDKIRVFYQLTLIYEYLVVRRRNNAYFHQEINAILCLFTKILNSPNLEELSLPEVSIIIYFFSKYSRSLSSVSLGKFHLILARIFKRYPTWCKSLLAAKSIFHSLAKDNTLTPSLKASLYQALDFGAIIKDQEKRSIYINNLLQSMLYLQAIDKNILAEKYQKILNIIDSEPDNYIDLTLTLCRASIWDVLPNYWEKSLTNLSKSQSLPGKNSLVWMTLCQTIPLLKQEMSPELYNKLVGIIQIELNQQRLKKYVDQYNAIYSSHKAHQKNFYQLNIDDILRNIGKKTEFQTFMNVFSIDIMVDGRIIIEPNGPDHYVFDENMNILWPTLNAAFKKKMFSKFKEYEFVDINLMALEESAAHTVKRLLFKTDDTKK